MEHEKKRFLIQKVHKKSDNFVSMKVQLFEMSRIFVIFWKFKAEATFIRADKDK